LEFFVSASCAERVLIDARERPRDAQVPRCINQEEKDAKTKNENAARTSRGSSAFSRISAERKKKGACALFLLSLFQSRRSDPSSPFSLCALHFQPPSLFLASFSCTRLFLSFHRRNYNLWLSREPPTARTTRPYQKSPQKIRHTQFL
jgi:hypothetical protein